MKRKGLFLVTLVLTICMVSQVMVLANWEPYYEQQYVSGSAVKVHKSYNDAGQTVYSAYDAHGNLILDIRARGGNIWNETAQMLYTSKNKGADYVGISTELDVFGISYTTNPLKYRNGFEKGEVPYVLPNVYATGMQTDNNGVLIGFYTNNGTYNIQGDGCNTNTNNMNNTNNYSQYARVVQDGNDYYYYYSDNNYYTYNFNPNTRYLKKNSSKLSNITEIAFGQGYIGAVTTSNKVSVIPVGQNLKVTRTYDSHFAEWIYQTSNSYWIIGYRDVYGKTYYFDNYNNGYNNNSNYNDSYNDNYYNGKYPYFYQDGTKLIYCKSSNVSYKYSLASKKLTYNGVILSDTVDQVEFSEGYLVYVNTNLECRRVRLGNTTSEHVCYNFLEFDYDYDGFVTQAISSRTGSHDL